MNQTLAAYLGLGGISAGGSVPVTFDPSSISGLVAWHKADAGVTQSGGFVSSWADQSGHGFDVSQGTGSYQPRYVANAVGSRPGILFDGADDILSNPTMNNSVVNGTLFAVFTQNYYGSFHYQTPLSLGFSKPSIVNENPNYDMFGIADPFASAPSYYYQAPVGNVNFVAGGWTGNAGKIYNGTTQSSSFSNATSGNVDTYAIGGCNPLNTTFRMFGYVFETIYYDHQLTDAEVLQVQNYLAARWSPGYDTDAVTYFANVISNSGAMNLDTRILANQHILNLKADGIWPKLYVYNPVFGENLNAALVAMKYDPAMGYAAVNHNISAGDYSKTAGLTGDGSTKYADSLHHPYAVSTDGTNMHMMVMVHNTPNSRPFGVFRAAVYTRHYLPIDQGNGNWTWGNQSSSANSAVGMYFAQRLNSSVNAELWINGTSTYTFNPDNSAPSDHPAGVLVSLGSATGDGLEPAITDSFSNSVVSSYSIGTAMTSTQAAAFYTRVAAFQASYGR